MLLLSGGQVRIKNSSRTGQKESRSCTHVPTPQPKISSLEISISSLSRSFPRSLVRSFACSLVRSFARSLVRSFARSLVRSFARSPRAFSHVKVVVGATYLCPFKVNAAIPAWPFPGLCTNDNEDQATSRRLRPSRQVRGPGQKRRTPKRVPPAPRAGESTFGDPPNKRSSCGRVPGRGFFPPVGGRVDLLKRGRLGSGGFCICLVWSNLVLLGLDRKFVMDALKKFRPF